MISSDHKKQDFHIEVTEDDKTALDYLTAESGLSRQKIKTAMQKGCVWLEWADHQNNNSVTRLRRAKKILSAGSKLHFYYDENILEQTPQAAVLISDEGDYSIWYKPSGLFSQGSKWGDHCTIQRWAEKHLTPERVAFVVHRLDRAANGLIIIAHKKKVAAQFGRMFEQREIEKVYHVWVEGHFNSLEVNDCMTIDSDLDGKKSVSHVTLLKLDEKNNQSYLEVKLETGRKHQIRKHLSGLGFPVVGDRLYGSPSVSLHASGHSMSAPVKDLQLSAVRLSFICPVSHKVKNYTL